MADADGMWSVALDGRGVKLPGGTPLRVRSGALADAIAQEWDAAGATVGGTFSPLDLPLTRIAGTMIERIAPNRSGAIDLLAAYADADLLSYRAGPLPDPLLAGRQAAAWGPWIDWAREHHALDLPITTGVMPLPRDPARERAARAVLATRGDAALAALGVAVPALGSLVLGLALADGRLDAAEATALATLDDEAQLDVWGDDPEARARLATIARDVTDAARFMALADA
ncbi:ATP synthase F1 mitochondrial assembly chaperone ATP12 [Ameyamaea chiangmaiensis NBRC 103196]|nr:ATP synthase F1 mitochondrial assembly chaperone ATP12 [Ameyamaea chiangmaiensis NBRC 103196]